LTNDHLLTAASYASQVGANGQGKAVAQMLTICNMVAAKQTVGAFGAVRRQNTKKHAKSEYFAELKRQRRNKNTAVGMLDWPVWFWILWTVASKVFELWWANKIQAVEAAQ